MGSETRNLENVAKNVAVGRRRRQTAVERRQSRIRDDVVLGSWQRRKISKRLVHESKRLAVVPLVKHDRKIFSLSLSLLTPATSQNAEKERMLRREAIKYRSPRTKWNRTKCRLGLLTILVPEEKKISDRACLRSLLTLDELEIVSGRIETLIINFLTESTRKDEKI